MLTLNIVKYILRLAPYGEALDSVTKNAKLTNSPFGFTVETHDIEGGLVYLRARYYEPNTMRFIQQDTELGDTLDPLTRNLYAYANNNPLTYVDPSGNRVEYDGGSSNVPTDKPVVRFTPSDSAQWKVNKVIKISAYYKYSKSLYISVIHNGLTMDSKSNYRHGTY